MRRVISMVVAVSVLAACAVPPPGSQPPGSATGPQEARLACLPANGVRPAFDETTMKPDFPPFETPSMPGSTAFATAKIFKAKYDEINHASIATYRARNSEMVADFYQYMRYLYFAAEQGLPEAQVDITYLYFPSEIVQMMKPACRIDKATVLERNNQAILTWLTAAARQGYAPAQYQLAQGYLNRIFSPICPDNFRIKGPSRACEADGMTLLRKAAEGGIEDAQKEMARRTLEAAASPGAKPGLQAEAERWQRMAAASEAARVGPVETARREAEAAAVRERAAQARRDQELARLDKERRQAEAARDEREAAVQRQREAAAYAALTPQQKQLLAFNRCRQACSSEYDQCRSSNDSNRFWGSLGGSPMVTGMALGSIRNCSSAGESCLSACNRAR